MKGAAGFLGMAFLAATKCVAASETSLLSEHTIRRWSVEDGMPESAVVAIRQRADGYLWCATPRHLLRFDGVRFVEMPGEAPFVPVPVEVVNVPPGVAAAEVTATVKGDGAVWVGTGRGLYRLHEGQWSALTARDGVFPADVRCLERDREGNIWVGTSGGLVRLRRRSVMVYRTGSALGSESITALLAESPTNFWVGVAGGGLLAGPPDGLTQMRVGRMPENATVSALCRSRDGALWIGTQGDHLWRLEADGSALQVREASNSGVSAQGVNALLEDRRGRLWVGTWDGLMRLRESGELAPVVVRTVGPQRTRLLDDAVQVLCEDSSGRLWVGYQRSGLIRIEVKGGAEQFHEDVGVLSGSLFALYWDGTGTFWMGTSRGLGRWRGEECLQFTTENGLPDNVVLQVIEDATGNLWMGTRQGLMRVRKPEFDEIAAGRKTVAAARHFGRDAGMADEECTGRFGARAVRTSDGRLWFPTMEGIVSVDPGRISPQRAAPVAGVEEVRLGEESVSVAARVRLPLGRRDVEFRFTAPALTAPEQTHFKFQLEGHDAGWGRATAECTAAYSMLRPGEYRFRVMARNRDSDWSAPSDDIAVIVPPFFWETVAFWAVLGAMVVAGVGMGVRAFYRRQAAMQLDALERRHALERERERIARDIHDDVGAGLTEVAMLSELAQEERQRPAKLKEHLDAIFRRARELAQSLDEIVWAVNPANDTLESLLSYVGESAQGFLSAGGLACRLDFPPEPHPLAIGAAVRHHLCLAIKEALHNVVKHAGATEVRLSIGVEGRTLTVRMRDNGRGFESGVVPGVESGRDGLANLQARLGEIGGRFRQESVRGRGTDTILSVELPTPGAASGRTG